MSTTRPHRSRLALDNDGRITYLQCRRCGEAIRLDDGMTLPQVLAKADRHRCRSEPA